MKYFLIVVLLLSSCTATKSHRCDDSTHANCDGSCICDGFECPKR